VAALRRAVELEPTNGRLHRDLGSVLSVAKRYEEAAEAYRAAIERGEDSWTSLKSVLEKQGHHAEAIAVCREGLEKAGRPLSLLNTLAWTLATSADPSLRDPGEAVSLAREAVELAERPTYYRLTLGVALLRAGDPDAAATELEAVVAHYRSEWVLTRCRLFLAMARFEQGRIEEARELLGQASAWIDENRKDDATLARFRAEAEALLAGEGR
jgi:tetratricopeptide (TPR) repeat protein